MIELGNKAKKSIQVMISIGFVVEEQDDEENINYVINDDEQNINQVINEVYLIFKEVIYIMTV